MRTTWFRWAVIALMSLAAMHGQIGGGSLVGNVTDPSGAAVSGVKVKAISVATNIVEETATNESGYYEFPLLPAGRYRVEAEAKGFQKAASPEFSLNSGTRPRLDLALTLGALSENVQVTAQTSLVNATTTELGVVVDRSKVDALPLNGRNFQQLVGLQAGVINSPSSGAGGRGGIEFHGSSGLANNLMLDGVDMSFGEVNGSASDSSAGGGGSLINTVSVEAIEEFKASGSSFSAEYGRSAGGVLNITTKSGANRFHGTLFEFFRNDKLDANSFFNNRSGLKKPPLRWNQYGGNIGGPIKRDRIFFFFNYEGAEVRRAAGITGNTFTPALLTQLKPEIRSVIEGTLPAATESTTNPLVGFHRRNDGRKNSENTYLSRLDAEMGRHRLSGRYSYNHQDYTVPNFQPTLPRLFPTRFNNGVIQDNWNIGPSRFNELRVGVNRVDLFRNEPGREKIPAWITVGGVGINASLPSYIHFITTTYTLADNFTWIHNKHSIKAGFEIREIRSVRGQGGQPTYTYNNLDDLIADRANRVQVLFGGGKGLRNRNYGFYLQDDWRLTTHLQLNLGMRYEYSPPLKGGFNISGSDPYGPFIKAQQPMFAPDKNNWGPRLGLVWDPAGHQKFVVRAGGGVGYLPPQPIFFYDMAYIDPALPFVTNFTPTDVPAQYRPFPIPQAFIDSVAANPSLLPAGLILARQIADYNSRDTYAGQWNLSLQYAVNQTLAVQAAYVGSRTVKLIAPRTLNLVDPKLGRRPHPEFGDIQFMANDANISYHALQLSANQKLRHGMNFDAYYTWGKSLAYAAADSTQSFAETSMQDPTNLRNSYGPKQGDLRHRFVGVYSIEIPTGGFAKSGITKAAIGGWTFQGIVTARSGLPVNILAGRELYPNGRQDGQRPDLVGGVDPYVRNASSLVWLNPAAFDNNAPAAQRRFGNLGYNVFRGPTGLSYDAALHKVFAITEAHRITFRFEMFNALNHAVLSNPVNSVTNPNFGRITGASDGRNIQFALKYQF